MEKNINDATISPHDQQGFLLNTNLRNLIEQARFHRKINWHGLKDLYTYDLARGKPYLFFRNCATVKLSLPIRSGATTWCQRYLAPEDLYISKANWDKRSFKCQVTKLNMHDVAPDAAPNLIVIDNASYVTQARLDTIYTRLGKDPENQLFLLLG